MADTKYQIIKIYMRSGNVICLDYVANCTISSKGNAVTQLTLTQANNIAKECLMVTSIALDQIEAVTCGLQNVQD